MFNILNKLPKSFIKKYPHIKLLPTNVGHKQLIKEGIDCVLTVIGSIGFEYPLFGIPVINASTKNATINFDFNIHLKSIAKFKSLLLNPKKINEFKKTPLQLNDIVFLGNSLTASGQNWSERLDHPNIKNRGIGGDVSDGVYARLEEVIHIKPKAVFLLIGINDIWNNGSPNIPSPEYIGANIIKIARYIKIRSPESKVYVQTILPIREKKYKDVIKKVNQIIKSRKFSKMDDGINFIYPFYDKRYKSNYPPNNALQTKVINVDAIKEMYVLMYARCRASSSANKVLKLGQ